MSSAWGLAAVAVLILVTAFFVGAEFALVAADRTRVKARADAGSKAAKQTLSALEKLSFQLSGAQLGITVTSIVIGYIAEPAVGRLLHPLIEPLGLSQSTTDTVAMTAALVLATVVQMVLGELVPKNYALAHPMGTAMVLVPPLRATNIVMGPLIRFFNGAADRTLRFMGIEPKEELEGVRSMEELAILMRTSADAGGLAPEAAALVRRSLTFAAKTALDALRPRTAIEVVARTATVAEMVALSQRSGHSRFPVVGDDIDDIVGTVHVKDAFKVLPPARANTSVSKLVQPAVVVPETAPLDTILGELGARRTQMAIVVDEHGGTAGIITAEDIVEELVGEIADEYDREVSAPATRLGTWLVDAMAHHDELLDMTGYDLADGEWETLAGYLLWRFGRIPESGEMVVDGNWTFEVVRLDGRRIADVRVARGDEPPDQEDGA